MSLNIKNEEAHGLAQEVAALTGESLTAAETQALRERLERLHAETDEEFVERILVIGRNAAKRWKEPYRSMDHGGLLYDEEGLPK